jgi:excinuclease ABC subunit A
LLSQKEKEIVLYGTGEKTYKIKFQNEYGENNVYSSKFEGVINTLERRYFD